MQLSLLVIKTHQPERLKQFYELLGLNFREEKHGEGPVHFSSFIQQTLFEIYPLPDSIDVADTTTRLGFSVENLIALTQYLKDAGFNLIAEPRKTEWGFRAVIKDPDGRSVELLQAQ